MQGQKEGFQCIKPEIENRSHSYVSGSCLKNVLKTWEFKETKPNKIKGMNEKIK